MSHPTTTEVDRTGPATTARRAGRARFSGWRSRDGLATVLIALPAFLIFLYFSWGPIVKGLILSWQKTNLVDAPTWVGWDNFSYVLSDPLLSHAALNTVWFTTLALLIGFPVPLALAVFISELRTRRGLFSALAYLPVVVPPVVSILLWRIFYDPGSGGVFNTIVGWFGAGPLLWLNSPTMAMPAIVVEATWASAGTAVIIYLAALTSVRNDLYEAAELDGAGIWSRVWHVTLPQLRGVILVMLLLQIIATMQVFTQPFLFTGGGPENSTLTILMMIYNYAFINGDYGAATALSFMLALVLGVFSLLYYFLTRGWSTE